MKTKMNTDIIRKFLFDTKGKFFTVTFIKRTNGEKRKMIARLMPQKGGLPYDADEKKLMIVYDMQKLAYRAIPLDNVISAKCGKMNLSSEQ